jgi:hypothetical protein
MNETVEIAGNPELTRHEPGAETMNAASTPNDLRSMAAGARSVGLSPSRVRALVARGKLTAIQLPGGRPLISISQLKDLMRSSTTWGSGVAG